jgi:hypothetical protein
LDAETDDLIGELRVLNETQPMVPRTVVPPR